MVVLGDGLMPQPPILKTMDDMLAKLAEATRVYRESEKAVREYTDAIRALAQVCEDEEVKASYLLALEDISGKPGFMEAIRSVIRGHSNKPHTPAEIRTWIVLGKRLDLSGYSNPMASIHTTLRRLKDKGEIEEVLNEKGEKAYVLSPGSPGVTLPNQTDIAEQRRLRPQERFKLEHTKGK
jgi:hypothetical protein